ncbi:MAG: HDOD domain-containing protein [Bryobacteraceae bacterium]|nr:HDOD domain-containing protein [Bryobacteraceae bacterium]
MVKQILNEVLPEARLEIPPGTAAHCRRVAAWSEELARSFRCTSAEVATATDAALMHHQPELVRGEAFRRLAEDLGIDLDSIPGLDYANVSALSEAVLSALHSRSGTHTDSSLRLAAIIDSANSLDEQLEFAPYEDNGIEDVPGASPAHPARLTEVLKRLQRATAKDLPAVLNRLPVYPATAMRLYALLNEDVGVAALERVANTDQVIAGTLIKAANSVRYSPLQPIRTVSQAIGYVGTTDAQRILLATSVKTLYQTPRLRRLWQHALEAAQVAEKIAALAGGIAPGEAFLLGLLHDVGKLTITLLPHDVNESLERLSARGCQISTAEFVLCGFDHAHAGAETLKHWNFPEELVTAVHYHHQPEKTDSRMAAVLYLTEFWTDAEEDLPSNARLKRALAMAELSEETFETARIELNDAFNLL